MRIADLYQYECTCVKIKINLSLIAPLKRLLLPMQTNEQECVYVFEPGILMDWWYNHSLPLPFWFINLFLNGYGAVLSISFVKLIPPLRPIQNLCVHRIKIEMRHLSTSKMSIKSHHWKALIWRRVEYMELGQIRKDVHVSMPS